MLTHATGDFPSPPDIFTPLEPPPPLPSYQTMWMMNRMRKLKTFATEQLPPKL